MAKTLDRRMGEQDEPQNFMVWKCCPEGLGAQWAHPPTQCRGLGLPLLYMQKSQQVIGVGAIAAPCLGTCALFRDQGTPCPCPIPCMRTARNLPTKDASVGTSSPTTAEVLEALALDSTTSPMLQVLPPIDVIHGYFRPCSPVPTAGPSDRSGYTGGKVAACSSLFHSDRIWVRL